MESEKVKEIKKALKYCCGECDCDCPFYKNGKSYEKCKSLLLFEALTLINELEKALEKEQINNLNCDTDLQYKEKRIAELEEYIKGNEQDAKAFVNGWHKDLETELKQFAERLKEYIEHHHGNYGDLSYSECEQVIDETLKEFIEC